jgi:hypothetical protein
MLFLSEKSRIETVNQDQIGAICLRAISTAAKYSKHLLIWNPHFQWVFNYSYQYFMLLGTVSY